MVNFRRLRFYRPSLPRQEDGVTCVVHVERVDRGYVAVAGPFVRAVDHAVASVPVVGVEVVRVLVSRPSAPNDVIVTALGEVRDDWFVAARRAGVYPFAVVLQGVEVTNGRVLLNFVAIAREIFGDACVVKRGVRVVTADARRPRSANARESADRIS